MTNDTNRRAIRKRHCTLRVLNMAANRPQSLLDSDLNDGKVRIVGEEGFTGDHFKLVLQKLASGRRRTSIRAKRQRLDGINAILAKLPPPVLARELSFIDNEAIGDAGMEHLLLMPDSIYLLRFRHCGLTHVGIKLLCQYLEVNTSMFTLEISWDTGGGGGDEGAKHVSDMLRVNKTLKILSLCQTQIGPDGLARLAEGLAVNDTLQNLWLDTDVTINDEHIKRLFQGLKANRGVDTVWLKQSAGYFSEFLTPEGIQHIAECLRTNHYLTTIVPFLRVGVHDIDAREPLRDEPAWLQVKYLLKLNALGRKTVFGENATLSDWLDSIIESSQDDSVGYTYYFLRSKPELCMHS